MLRIVLFPRRAKSSVCGLRAIILSCVSSCCCELSPAYLAFSILDGMSRSSPCCLGKSLRSICMPVALLVSVCPGRFKILIFVFVLFTLKGTEYQDGLDSGIDSFNVSFYALIAFSFIPAAWMAYIVREKETKCKHQQVMSRPLPLLLKGLSAGLPLSFHNKSMLCCTYVPLYCV